MASPPPTNSSVTLAPDTPAPGVQVRAGVLGIGAYAPEDVITNAELEARVETSDAWIMERTGVRERRRMGSGETASTMGAEAARAALERAGNPSIDAILVTTASPDTLFPSTACLVQRRLDLGGIPAFDVGAACSGFIYGLVVAESLIRSGRIGTALVIGSEAMTRLVDYGDPAPCVRFGNTSSASIPLALAEADRAGRLRPGDRILSMAFGSGATWGGVALEWSLEPRPR